MTIKIRELTIKAHIVRKDEESEVESMAKNQEYPRYESVILQNFYSKEHKKKRER